ncbi:complement C1q subcomponent subunit A-like isoform 1-T3 [Pholidichthys leucotaenia]
MRGCYSLAVLVGMAFLLRMSQADVSCGGQDGQSGQPGTSGRYGLPGVKGEKGEPAIVDGGPPDQGLLLRLKGDRGSHGPQGPAGPKGYSGDLGAAGPSGKPGSPGPDGRRIDQHSQQQAHSAFSVIRTETSHPQFNQAQPKKVTFQQTVTNVHGDFNTAEGIFTCRVPGFYYFDFHSLSKVSMCLQLVQDIHNDPEPASSKVGFCNYNRNLDQVLSGGVVLELKVGDKVWLESFRDQLTDTDVRDRRNKQIIFNGFFLNPQ